MQSRVEGSGKTRQSVPTIPTTFSTDAAELHSRLADRGYAARMVYVTVTDAPVWHDGDIVARVSGEYPAAYPTSAFESPVVLLDTGEISVLASWRVEEVR